MKGPVDQDLEFSIRNKETNYEYVLTPLEDQTDITLLIEQAAKLGHNVGQDEYDVASIRYVLFSSDVRVVKRDGKPVGCIMFGPSPYSVRHVGFFRIIIATEEKVLDQLYIRLARVCETLLSEMAMGYVGAMTAIFSRCKNWYQLLEKQDYVYASCTPNAGKFNGRDDEDSYLMYKQFSPIEIKGKIVTDNDLLEARNVFCQWYKSINPGTEDQFPKLDYLVPPKTFKIGSLRLAARNFNIEDIPLLYDMFFEAARKGAGYTLDYIGSIEYFTIKHMKDTYGILLETMNGELVAFCGLTRNSRFSRSTSPKLCSCNLMINPNYQAIDLGVHITTFFAQSVMFKLGYIGFAGEAYSSNFPALEVFKKAGAIKTGSLPSVYIRNGKVVNSITLYLHFRSLVKSKLVAANL